MAGVKTEPGKLTMRNVSLRTCILWAYDFKPYQLSGPGWLGDARFDIAAKAQDTASDNRLRLMLRALLAERFGLRVHHEQKELPAYILTVTKNGPKVHESTTEGPPRFGEEPTGLVAERASMSDLAGQISRPLHRPVIDRTGLKGHYDFRIDIKPYLTQGDAGGGKEQGDELDPISLLFTGFQEQLGLKLDAGKDAVDVLVIDAANKVPTEN